MSDLDDMKTREYGQEYADSQNHIPRTSRCHHGNFVCQICASGKEDLSWCCNAPLTVTGFCTSCKDFAGPEEQE